MKKTLAAFFLALTLLTGSAAAFSDVDEGLYYAAPIAWAVERGITTGTSEDTFSPDALCTQGQILTFLWRAAGSPQADAGALPPGLAADSVNPSFLEAIAWAYQAGILSGSVGRLNPSAPCGRGMAMGFLWRYAGSPDASPLGIFTDVAPGADYAQAVAWAVETGITSGTSETTFSPNEPCTRGQIATFLYRCLNETGEKVQLPEEPVLQVPDEPAPEENGQPLRTYTGTGTARSLGLDGSEFTSEGVYEAAVTVDVYSPYEAVFTVQVPFPLYQACNYLVRFDNPETPDQSFLFIFLRWDEAFADMIPWEDDHDSFRFVDTSDPDGFLSVQQDTSGDDRIGGALVRRVTFSRDSGFTFDLLDGYTPSCSVTTSR